MSAPSTWRSSAPFVAVLLVSFVIGFTFANTPLQIEERHGFPNSLVRPIKHDVRTAGADYDRFKLPEDVVPTYYDISLIPILEEQIEGRTPWTAPGSVSINVDCLRTTSQIVIHKSPDLNVLHSSIKVLRSSDNFPVPVLPTFGFDPETEFYNISLGAPLQAQTAYRLYVEFIGKIYDKDERLEGLYRSSYTNAEGVISILVTTQFEPTDFRRMVPSFDEPHFKAPIKIRIGRLASKYISLSNSELMPGENGQPQVPQPIDAEGFEGWVWDDYRPTVPTPTYLVAIVVAEDYSFFEAPSSLYPKEVRTYGPSELITRGGGEFAAITAARQLDYFARTFELDYQMHKMHSIAIPDFSAGAMENWGLNTYRIPYLLNFPGETTEAERGLISNILAHELAHQWFGNTITCARWHYLWLNEGFATYASFLGWEETHPEFEPLKFFMNDAFQYSMIRDANAALTHPMVNDAVTTDEINSYFSPITYEKGGSLIRMMEGFLTRETLRKGLVLYLNDMLNKAAVQDDLFRNLNIQAQADGAVPENVTVKQIMDTWTLQAGFPIVRVSVASATRIYISQERVVPLKPLPDLNPNHLWYIPVAIATPSDADWITIPKLWLEPQYSMKSYSSVDTNQWIVVNPSATGYYRVLYDTKLTDLLLAQLNLDHTVFTPESRSQFLDDYLTLAFSRKINIETALEFTKYLGRETERIVWGATLTVLRNSFNKLRNSEAFEQFKRYLTPKLLSTLNAIGFRQEPQHNGANVILRATLLDWACGMDLQDCVNYAANLYNQWVQDSIVNPVPIDIQSVMYCSIVANGDASTFTFMFNRYDASTVPTQKTRLLNGLACTPDSVLVENILAEVLKEDSRFTEADKVNVLVRVAGNSKARTNVLNFLGTNLVALKGLPDSISRTLSALVANIGTSAELQAVTQFIEDNRAALEELALPLDSYLATMNNNIEWRAEYEDRMRLWFSSNA